MRLRSFLLNLGVYSLLLPQLAYSSTNAHDIRNSVVEFLDDYQETLQVQYGNNARIKHRIVSLDSRLNMSDCSSPLNIELRGQNQIGRINAKVECQNPGKWAIYVPVEIKVLQPVVISSIPIAKNTRLRASHLSTREIDISRIRGSYYFKPEDVINMETKRQLKPGAPITSLSLRPPMLVKKGDAVVLSADIGSLNVKTSAIAMSNGRQGQQIRVKNKRSKRIVDARVTGPGAVKATL